MASLFVLVLIGFASITKGIPPTAAPYRLGWVDSPPTPRPTSPINQGSSDLRPLCKWTGSSCYSGYACAWGTCNAGFCYDPPNCAFETVPSSCKPTMRGCTSSSDCNYSYSRRKLFWWPDSSPTMSPTQAPTSMPQLGAATTTTTSVCFQSRCYTPADCLTKQDGDDQLPTFNKMPSLALAGLGSIVAFYFMFQYVINGRFHQLSFYRRHLLERSVTYCRVVHTQFESYLANKKFHQQEQEREALKSRGVAGRKNTWLFFLLSFIILTVGTLLHFFLSILQLLFDAVLIYKGFYREGIDVPVSFLLSTTVFDLAIALDGWWISTVLSPIASVLLAISKSSLDLSSMGVHCNGMKLPSMLFLNVLVLGVVIIIVESNYIVFEQIALKKTLSVALKSTMSKGFQQDFGLTSGAYWARVVGALFLMLMVQGGLFMNCLKLAMTSVNFQPFFNHDWRNGDKLAHAYCDQSMRMDTMSANWAVLLAAIAVPAFLYSTVKFLVPVTIFEEGMHPHEVEASKNMFKRLWTMTLGATAKEGQAQSRTDEQSSYRTEADKLAAKKFRDDNAARLGLLWSYLTPDLWVATLTKNTINMYFRILHVVPGAQERRDFAMVAQTLGAEGNEMKIFEIASGGSKDPLVLDGWERHYKLRLPSLFNFMARVGETQRLEKANKNRFAAGSGAHHPAYKTKIPVKDSHGKVIRHEDAVVLMTKKGMRHKVKQIDRDVDLTSGRRSRDPPLSNLLNSDGGKNMHWATNSRDEAWIEVNIGQARVVTGYSLCKAQDGDQSTEPAAWTVYGLPIDPKGAELHKPALLGNHPLDMAADTVTEGTQWMTLHSFSEGEDGHFDHISHEQQGSEFVHFQNYGGRRLWQGKAKGFFSSLMMHNPDDDFELFELKVPVTVTRVRICFHNTRGDFRSGVSLSHMHVYLDKKVNTGYWLFAQIWRFVRITLQTYYVFITAALGFWFKSWAIAFELTRPRTHLNTPNISEQFEVDAAILHPNRGEDDDAESVDSRVVGAKKNNQEPRHERDSNLTEALHGVISARAVLFQALPGLSFLTVWVGRTVDCPLFVYDPHMRHQLPPFLTSFAEAVAHIKAEKPEQPSFLALLQAPKHMWEHSRGVKFAVGVTKFALAVVVLYGKYRTGIMLAASVLLLPVSLVECMSVVAQLADAWHLKTEDVFGAPTSASESKKMEDPPALPATLTAAHAARRQSLLDCSNPTWKRPAEEERHARRRYSYVPLPPQKNQHHQHLPQYPDHHISQQQYPQEYPQQQQRRHSGHGHRELPLQSITPFLALDDHMKELGGRGSRSQPPGLGASVEMRTLRTSRGSRGSLSAQPPSHWGNLVQGASEDLFRPPSRPSSFTARLSQSGAARASGQGRPSYSSSRGRDSIPEAPADLVQRTSLSSESRYYDTARSRESLTRHSGGYTTNNPMRGALAAPKLLRAARLPMAPPLPSPVRNPPHPAPLRNESPTRSAPPTRRADPRGAPPPGPRRLMIAPPKHNNAHNQYTL